MTFTIPKKQRSPLAVVEGASRNNLCEKTSFHCCIFCLSLFLYLYIIVIPLLEVIRSSFRQAIWLLFPTDV